MAHMFTISGNESDTSGSDTPDVVENSQLGNNLKNTKNPGEAQQRCNICVQNLTVFCVLGKFFKKDNQSPDQSLKPNFTQFHHRGFFRQEEFHLRKKK